VPSCECAQSRLVLEPNAPTQHRALRIGAISAKNWLPLSRKLRSNPSTS
jgi:hypothetical protein